MNKDIEKLQDKMKSGRVLTKKQHVKFEKYLEKYKMTTKQAYQDMWKTSKKLIDTTLEGFVALFCVILMLFVAILFPLLTLFRFVNDRFRPYTRYLKNYKKKHTEK